MMPEVTHDAMTLIAVASVSYLVGAIPFGVVFAKLLGLGNLRDVGSGNIGATNVLRTGSKPAAFLTLIFDAGKAAVMVVLARAFIGGEDVAQLAGLAAFIGHLFPVWLGFRGGKGVATYLGALLALFFLGGFAACMTWLLLAVMFRISSLAALGAAVAVPLWLVLLGRPELVAVAVIMGALIWMRHGANIRRIIAGTEPRIKLGK